jgi:hypothetical protein
LRVFSYADPMDDGFLREGHVVLTRLTPITESLIQAFATSAHIPLSSAYGSLPLDRSAGQGDIDIRDMMHVIS